MLEMRPWKECTGAQSRGGARGNDKTKAEGGILQANRNLGSCATNVVCRGQELQDKDHHHHARNHAEEDAVNEQLQVAA